MTEIGGKLVVELRELEVIGYADVLDERLVPHIVTPVYRFRGKSEVLYPPFRLAGEVIVGGTIICKAEMEHVAAAGNATVLDKPIPAQPDHELWLDQEMRPQYEPFKVAEGRLRTIAAEALAHARAALAKDDLDAADKAAGVALAADDRLLDPFVIKAAVARLRERTDEADALRELALVDAKAETFDQRLEDCLKSRRERPPPADNRP